MALWTTYPTSTFDTGKPGKGSIIEAIYDNATAVAQQASGAPAIIKNWYNEEFTSSGTFTVPDGVTTVIIEMCGGGGGGGGLTGVGGTGGTTSFGAYFSALGSTGGDIPSASQNDGGVGRASGGGGGPGGTLSVATDGGSCQERGFKTPTIDANGGTSTVGVEDLYGGGGGASCFGDGGDTGAAPTSTSYGAGGGGTAADSATYNYGAGGGGGSGLETEVITGLTPAETVTVTIGTPGAGGTGGTAGGAGIKGYLRVWY